MIDFNSGNLLQELSGHTDSVQSLTISNDNQYLISGSMDKTIRIWKIPTGIEEQVLTGHSEGIITILSIDNKKIISASADTTIRIWGLKQELKQEHKQIDPAQLKQQETEKKLREAPTKNTKPNRYQNANESEDQQRLNKLKKIIKVCDSLELSQMELLLGLSESVLLDKMLDWALAYGFRINNKEVRFSGGNIDAFLADLDKNYHTWDIKEHTKDE
jgi:hypothetical protein